MSCINCRLIGNFLFLFFMILPAVDGKTNEIPVVHSGLKILDNKLIYIDKDGDTLREKSEPAQYTLSRMRGKLTGTETGLKFDFGSDELKGRLYYGFIPSTEEVKYAHPVYFKRTAAIDSGRAEIDIKNNMAGKYDMINWQESGLISLGYRVVTDKGYILYDGKIRLRGSGPFVVDSCIIEGPFVNLLTDNSATVSFESNVPIKSSITIDDRTFFSKRPTTHHEIELYDLRPDTKYDYTVHYGKHTDKYFLRTAPSPGSRSSFVFAYASDGRGNTGGGERHIYGVNAYMMKKIAALVLFKETRFFQFTGDLINGYKTDAGEMALEYANWKRVVEPFAHYVPFIAGIGNHEVLNIILSKDKKSLWLDKFPFKSNCTETLFAEHFVNPKNGPVSEDGCKYDPDPNKTNFPPYDETAFYYTYDNVAMISLNSNYWYAPDIESYPEVGGNPHAYIMDNQLQWMGEVLALLENDSNIDHVFITLHTPIFPNGGHVSDDIWYDGNNDIRPYISGQPVDKGIIERRDEILDMLMNHSSKVLAVLTGDEHNYNRFKLTEDVPIYPDNYPHKKLSQFRPIWFINNGAAGAPYYAMERTPWSSYVDIFSTQNAVVFFHVDGKEVRVEVYNPDTLELIDEYIISEG